MLRLQILGGIVVLDGHGRVISSATVHRRPAAILGALALAGDQGLSRDKLMGLLWPESDAARAAHSLSQAVYAIRRATGLDDLITTTGPLRLNTTRIITDVEEMEQAFATGDLDRAAALYGGPLLDGFFVPAAPDFDQWVSVHRARVENRIFQALDAEAERLERHGLHALAAKWRTEQAVVRPLDSAVAARLIVALAQAGDRGGALRHAQVHEALLRSQLDLPLGPDVERIVAELRAGSFGSDLRLLSPRPPGDSPTDPATTAGAGSEDALIRSRERPQARSFPRLVGRPRSWRRVIAVAVAAVVLVAVGARTRRYLSPVAPGGDANPAASSASSIAVAPFQVAGVDPSLAYLGTGLAELLTPRLVDDSIARSPDIGEVLEAWQQVGLSVTRAVPRGRILGLAQQLGVARIVVGTVAGMKSRLLLTATVLAVPSGRQLAMATVQGSPDSITALADRLATDLLVAEAGESERFTEGTRYALSAVRRYVAGHAADQRGDYGVAATAYESALAKDSTFALAALDLARVSTTLGEPDRADVALAKAWSHRTALGSLDLARLIAATGPNYPRPSSAAQQLAAWEQVVRLAPAQAEAWAELGAHLAHDGARLGMATANAHAAMALNHALVLDSGRGVTTNLLAQLRLREDSSGPLSGPGDTAPRDRPRSTEPASFLAWRAGVAARDGGVGPRPLLDLRQVDRATLRAIAMASQFDGVGLDDGLEAVHLLRARARTTDERVDAVLAEHSLMLNAGRPRDALATTERLRELRPDSHAYLRLRMLDALYASGDTAAAAASARALAAPLTPGFSTFPLSARQRLADVCVLGQWRLAHADTTGVAGVIRTLREGDPSRQSLLVSSSPIVCADLLEASLAVATRRDYALALVNGIDSLVLTSTVSGNASSYVHIAVARLFNTLGYPDRALAAIRKRPYMTGWPAYLAMAWRHESALATLTGDAHAALVAYHRYLALRSGGGPGGGPEVAIVRASIPVLAK